MKKQLDEKHIGNMRDLQLVSWRRVKFIKSSGELDIQIDEENWILESLNE